MLVTSVFSVLAFQLAAAASIPRIDSANTSGATDAATLFKRYPLTCDSDRYTAIAEDAARAIDYLRSIGSRACVVPEGNGKEIEFKRFGSAIIRGHNKYAVNKGSNDVARGAGLIMDKCTRFDGVNNRVTGLNAAWGNGCLVVIIEGH
ncbi:hypothetical protein NM208_g3200 [Fusarium decemcellulare]|uniref:Uncharacterized protein n=2 Tax=Fusarium decemcellulare TaxID=57161 RepID=A0ACC1SHP4_9HYPO|nr:hypothetical protein NM208_g5272 [Fusarium decemcellulare]KAJ3544164.1 hypothetical protein NM208_g3200 [Fusarium decemcellulare]